MGAKRCLTKQIIVKLREAEVELAKGATTPEVARELAPSNESSGYGCSDRTTRVRSTTRAEAAQPIEERQETHPAVHHEAD